MLKAKLNSLEEVKGQTIDLSELYKEENGNFILDVESVDGYSLQDVGGLKKVMEEAKAERDELKTKLKEATGQVDSLKLSNSQLEAGVDTKNKEKLDAVKDELEASYKAKLEEMSKEKESLTQKLENVSIDSELNRVVSLLNLTDTGKKVLPKLVRDNLALDEAGNAIVKNEKGVARIGDKFGNMTIEEYMTVEVKKEFPDFFVNTTGGSGSNGGNGGNGSGSHTGKTILQSEFDALDPRERSKILIDPETGKETGVKVIPD